MATSKYDLQIQARLDTTQVQQQLNQLRSQMAQFKTNMTGGANNSAAANSNINLNSSLRALQSSIDRLNQAINRLNMQSKSPIGGGLPSVRSSNLPYKLDPSMNRAIKFFGGSMVLGDISRELRQYDYLKNPTARWAGEGANALQSGLQSGATAAMMGANPMVAAAAAAASAIGEFTKSLLESARAMRDAIDKSFSKEAHANANIKNHQKNAELIKNKDAIDDASYEKKLSMQGEATEKVKSLNAYYLDLASKQKEYERRKKANDEMLKEMAAADAKHEEKYRDPNELLQQSDTIGQRAKNLFTKEFWLGVVGVEQKTTQQNQDAVTELFSGADTTQTAEKAAAIENNAQKLQDYSKELESAKEALNAAEAEQEYLKASIAEDDRVLEEKARAEAAAAEQVRRNAENEAKEAQRLAEVKRREQEAREKLIQRLDAETNDIVTDISRDEESRNLDEQLYGISHNADGSLKTTNVISQLDDAAKLLNKFRAEAKQHGDIAKSMLGNSKLATDPEEKQKLISLAREELAAAAHSQRMAGQTESFINSLDRGNKERPDLSPVTSLGQYGFGMGEHNDNLFRMENYYKNMENVTERINNVLHSGIKIDGTTGIGVYA